MSPPGRPQGEYRRAPHEGAPVNAAALIGRGTVRHTRLRPVLHAFAYPTWFLMLPMRSLRRQPLAALPRNRAGVVSFHDADHGAGGADALAWFEDLLRQEGVDGVDGEVWLQTYPRVLGYAFKPVSFWYGHAADGRLKAVLAEVNNTFGERHCYLLHGEHLAFGRELLADKVFHVSPFCAVQGAYRFRFMQVPAQGGQPPRLIARVDHEDADGPLLQTSVSGQLTPLTRAALWRAWAAMPLLTLGVMARIHWQALRLWLKRVPFLHKPTPPSALVSR
ncbi:protein of unknown function DUF1365 [Leptothrix cholodnii SP-6]|uniref:DUF1365 domain-containing protein n=1 Tax=Leptothrix cholodnii (strain ATCC 51168 / LMG 8142 / SP-6) TaxID=395495 RepID=B1XXW9_LEPCP|nr:protein of unknown function DUF1365 [Leptothrix cholodnii SP-6]